MGQAIISRFYQLYDVPMPENIHKGVVALFASVGAGMNINALAYQF